jgi:hypothetical protein
MIYIYIILYSYIYIHIYKSRCFPNLTEVIKAAMEALGSLRGRHRRLSGLGATASGHGISPWVNDGFPAGFFHDIILLGE